MEEITLNAFQVISSYGGIGAALAYFMVKDFKQGTASNETNKAVAITLEKLVVAINTLASCRNHE